MLRTISAILLVATPPVVAARTGGAPAVLRAAAKAMGRFPNTSLIEASGSIEAEGRTGQYREIVRIRDGAFLFHTQYKLFGEGEGYDGEARWKQDRSGAAHYLNAPFTRRETVTLAWLKRRGYLQPGRARVEALVHATIDGRPAEILTMVPRGGNSVRLAFDDVSHLLVRVQRDRPLSTVTETYKDYRRVDSLRVPFDISIEDGGDVQTIHPSRYARLARLAPALFSVPPRPDDTVMTASSTLPLGALSYAVVPASINGHEYDFVLDTGGHDIVLPPIAAKLGLRAEGQGSSGGSGPGRVTTSDTEIAELKLGSATMTNQHFAVLDLGTGFQTKGQAPRAGILGLEIFERMAVTIDEPHNRLTIEPFNRVQRCQGDAIPLLFDDDQPAVRGTIDGVPAQIGIDVGNGGIPIVLWRWAEAHKVADRFRNGTVGTGSGVGGSNTTYRTSHHDIVIGRTALTDVDVNYATTATGYFSSRADSMNLGHALLQKYVVRFDYAHMQMCIMRP
jgi:hypothetical protein